MDSKYIRMGVLVFTLLIFMLWVMVLAVQVRNGLSEMKKFKDEAGLKLHVFNLRKSELWSEMLETRQNMYVNRIELAKVKGLFKLGDYNIVMVPMMVPGKAVVGPKPNNLSEKGEK